MEFVFTQAAKKQWAALSPDIQGLIQTKISEYKTKPALFEANLVAVQHLEPANHRLRVGNYRFLLQTNVKPGMHRVLKVGHRRDVYR